MIEGQELIKILRDNAPDGDEMYFCQLMSIFNEDDKHCAIFCNLADDFLELEEFLSISDNIYRNPFKTYALLLNSIVEKINIIKTIIDYKENFNNLTKIRRWANFFKHPKSFLFIHHPIFVYNQDSENASNRLFIDTEFISTYYKNNDHDAELKSMLTNKLEIEVLIPDLKELTQGFCNDINRLINVIKDNKDYIDKLMPYNINIEEYNEYD